jgi:hypothetical protein
MQLRADLDGTKSFDEPPLAPTDHAEPGKKRHKMAVFREISSICPPMYIAGVGPRPELLIADSCVAK